MSDERQHFGPGRAAVRGAVVAMTLAGVALPTALRVLPVTEGPIDFVAWAGVAVLIVAVFGVGAATALWLEFILEGRHQHRGLRRVIANRRPYRHRGR